MRKPLTMYPVVLDRVAEWVGNPSFIHPISCTFPGHGAMWTFLHITTIHSGPTPGPVQCKYAIKSSEVHEGKGWPKQYFTDRISPMTLNFVAHCGNWLARSDFSSSFSKREEEGKLVLPRLKLWKPMPTESQLFLCQNVYLLIVRKPNTPKFAVHI